MRANYSISCISCNRQFSSEKMHYTCPRCGPLKGTLQVNYDYAAISHHLNPKTLARNPLNTHWRYLPLLPVTQPGNIPSLQVGWTPLYRSKTLAKDWELKNLFIKDDSRNPTGSLKDRASSVAIVKMLEHKATISTVASTGNAASSWAAFAALAGVPAIIFVP